MKKHDPEEVHQMRESLRHFRNTVKTVSMVQSRLRESFTPPPSSEVMERLYIPPTPKTA